MNATDRNICIVGGIVILALILIFVVAALTTPPPNINGSGFTEATAKIVVWAVVEIPHKIAVMFSHLIHG